MLLKIGCVCLMILSLFRPIYSYFVTVDANAEECFFDRVKAGTKMGLTFEVAEGGFLDIDVRIMAPSGETICKGERETNGNYTFTANTQGAYTYCFSNKISTIVPKVVMFNMAIGEVTHDKKDVLNTNKLEDMNREISSKSP
ncbi:hypothetical protein HHI36_022689 [Cryptolaemus montrouzieri]|uniref:GOLD domain-containing protein n=1 Tax=Cryptolaemus montrouzieri TaxID=559131 RepID=A0ABD2N0N6_9CUCU